MTGTQHRSDVVATTGGPVRGLRRGATLAFRGIPYAAAPVGALRFAAPEPHPGWSRPRDAFTDGPTPTLGPIGDTHSIPEHPIPGDERLNLNVFTPSTEPPTALPVQVWIHGGSFVGGAPGSAWFDGGSFARHGVVTVAISYRLGFEGFGHIPGAPDNRAVLDWLAALRWVAENIAAFGGDPGRVCVAGQSAGASATLSLLATEEAQPLFHRAVSQSAPLPDLTLTAAEQVGAHLARVCDVEHTVAGWSAISREQIVDAERSMTRPGLWAGLQALNRLLREREPVTWFGPVVGAGPVPADVLGAYAAGAGADKPLLIGATSHEFNLAAEQIEQPLARRMSPMVLTGFGMPAVRARAYPPAFPDLSGTELLGQAITDRLFRMPVVRVGAARAKAPATAGTWIYDFRWRSPVTRLSTHCLDLPFSWDNLHAERVDRAAGDDPPQHLADQMHGALVAFLTGADPGWARYIPEAPTGRVFEEESWTGRDPYRFERLAVAAEQAD